MTTKSVDASKPTYPLGGWRGNAGASLIVERGGSEMERLSRSQATPRRLVVRARIVLACLYGEPQVAIAARFGPRPNMVGKWRDRFSRLGLKGLADAPRPGKPMVHVGFAREDAQDAGDAAAEEAGGLGRQEPRQGAGREQDQRLGGGRTAFIFSARAADGSAPTRSSLRRRRASWVATEPCSRPHLSPRAAASAKGRPPVQAMARPPLRHEAFGFRGRAVIGLGHVGRRQRRSEFRAPLP